MSRELPGLTLLVSVGGVIGSLGRFALAGSWPVEPGAFPWATLVTNLTGCFLLGLLVGSRPDDRRLRAFAGTGVLGGYTTFSAFALETDRLLARHCGGRAAGYVLASLLGGLLAAAAGLRAARR